MLYVSLVWAASACHLLVGDPTGPGTVSAEAFRPTWNLGDQWSVETENQQQQIAAVAQKSRVAQWRFSVQAVDQLGQRPCWRLVIQPLESDEPRMTVWVDRETAAIRQIQSQLPTPEGYQTVTETYQPESVDAPVIGSSALVPVAIPQFPDGSAKGLDVFRYNTLSGIEGTKAVGELEFSTEVRQSFVQPTAERLKGVLDEQRFKDLENRPLVEVVLRSPDAEIHQIWAAGSPWPIWSDNGSTKCRLIDVQPASGEPAIKDLEMPASNAAPAIPVPKTLEVSDGIERGRAKYVPWSGYWWPIGEGRLLIPLGKYDRLTDHAAAAWEKEHNPPGPDVPHWFGYCHAWSAASVLEREPEQGRTFRLAASAVNLDVGDQKGLVTACHTEDLANSWGDRLGDGAGSEDSQDIRPDLLWRLLKLHLGQQGVPLVLDIEAGEEVWNYPVYAYEVRYKPVSDEAYQAQLTLLMADDSVPPSYQGTRVARQTYLFSFSMKNSKVVAGSGRWLGRSAQDHPDFAWYPFKAVASNPEVVYPKVQQLVTAQATPDSPGTTEPQPGTPPATGAPPPTEQPAHPPTSPPADNATAAAPPATGPAAEPMVISPVELVAIITNKTSSFAFDATVDRFDGATYRAGETFFLRVTSGKPGYLYVLQVDTEGTPALLYPTAGEDNRILAGQSLNVRPAGTAGGFPVTGPAGLMRIKALVTARALAFSGCVETTQAEPSQQQRGKPDEPQTAEKPRMQKPPGKPAGFRWPPTQRRQIQEWLKNTEQVLDAGQLGCTAPEELLGSFAQDAVTFYVEAAESGTRQTPRDRQRQVPPRPKKDSAAVK